MVGALLATALAVPQAAPARADAAGKGGDFVPLAPAERVLDTRTAIGEQQGVKGPGSTTAVQVAGVGALPTVSGVSAVMIDVVAIRPTAGTYLLVYPDGVTPRPLASTVNVPAGEVLSNSAVVPVGSNGKIAVFNAAGNVDIIVDVQGYFTKTTGTVGTGVTAVPHTRLVDTRSNLGTTGGAIPAGSSRTVTLTGSVIPSGATAAFLDVIVVGSTTGGFLSVYPAGGTDRLSVLNYVTGTTSGGISAKLAADGRVTFVNHGGSPVHLVLTAEAYATASASTGAGMRAITPSRLLDTGSTPVPANGTVDVQVGGTNGLPTRAIEAAVVNLTVAGPTAGGFLQVSPYGGTEGTSSLVNFSAGIGSRAGMAVVQVGTEGKIRIRNSSSGTVRIIVDLQGWFADPLPGVALAGFQPTTVMQAAAVGTALGTVEYVYSDNLGRVRHGHQTNVDDFNSVQWTTLPGNDAFSGRPGLAQLSDGRLQVAAQNIDSNVWTSTQTSAGGSAWDAWAKIGGSMAYPPVPATLSDGTVVLFAVDADGWLWHYRQVGSTSYWRNLGSAGLVGQVAFVPMPSGLRLVGRGSDGTVRTAVYDDAGGLSAWTDLGGNTDAAPAVVTYPGYRTRVVIRAADGSVQTKIQDIQGAWTADWSSVGTFSAAGAPAAILDPVLGRTAIVVRGTDSEVYRVFETATGSDAWGSWSLVNPDVSDPAATDPAVAPVTNSSGQTWVIVFRNQNGATRVYDRGALTLTAARTAATAATVPFTAHTLPTPPR